MLFDLYRGSRDNTQRYVLGKSGDHKLVVVGINPSSADQNRSDVTATKVERFAGRCGFDGFVILNLYPIRSGSPKELPEIADPKAVRTNERNIRELTDRFRPALFWAAWGDAIDSRAWLPECLRRICAIKNLASVRWVQAGSSTVRRNPRHPSRMRYSDRFAPFDVDGYLKNKIPAAAG